MSNFDGFILRQRVLPVIIIYGLLPRSTFYFPRIDAMVAAVCFCILSLSYIIYRYKIITKVADKKGLIVLDSICALIGLIFSCIFNYNTPLALLFCVTAIPLFINNHTVLKNNNK